MVTFWVLCRQVRRDTTVLKQNQVYSTVSTCSEYRTATACPFTLAPLATSRQAHYVAFGLSPLPTMNGVRRLLGGGGHRSQSPPVAAQVAAEQPFHETAPLSLSNKPLWYPTPLGASMNEPPNSHSNSTSSSTILGQSPYVNGAQSRLNGNRQNSVDGTARTHSRGSSAASSSATKLTSPGSSPSTRAQSLSLSNGPSSPSRPLPSRVAQLKAWKRASGPVDARDELLISLLASEAGLDSRDFDILSAEDVEELKKVRLHCSVLLLYMSHPNYCPGTSNS